MKASRIAVLIVVVLVGIGLWLFVQARRSAATTPLVSAARNPTRNAASTPAAPKELFPVAALNSLATTIQDDVRLLQDVFTQWQSNFPSTGNPVGTNAEITAALCGDNPLKLDLIPRDLPAINAQGELCDRWGTPFRLHQLSGATMQVISAGPDRRFATADDVMAP